MPSTAEVEVTAFADEARGGLEVALDQARSEGHAERTLDALVRLAALELAVERPGLALPLLKEARTLIAGGTGAPLVAAQVIFLRAQALDRSGGDALAGYREAAAHFHALDRPDDALRARLRAFEALKGLKRWDDAIAELNEMVSNFGQLEADRRLVDCLRLRAGQRVVDADFDGALADYDGALAAAIRLGNPTQTLRIRLERRGVVPGSVGGVARWDDWKDLLSAAHGGESARQLRQATLAFEGERPLEGLAFASAARNSALDERQGTHYLMACLLIAEGREEQADHVGVLDVLLTCKAVLERLSRDLLVPLVAVLQALEPRWGKPAFARALAGFRRPSPPTKGPAAKA